MNVVRSLFLFTVLAILAGCNLTVTKTEGGKVSSESGAIDCGEICGISSNSKRTEILTANAETGFVFKGWEGACTGTETCTVSISNTSGNKTVHAVFESTTAGNPLDKPLEDPGALTLTGVTQTGFNPLSVQLAFNLQGASFGQNPSDVSLRINGTLLDPSSITVTSGKISAQVVLENGKNSIVFKAYDNVGRPLYLNDTLWAGGNSLTVKVADSSGAPITTPAAVTLRLADDTSLTVSGVTAGGTVTFQNIPTWTILVEALTQDNRPGITGVAGNEGQTTVTILDFNAPSAVDNNDLSQGLNGWDVGSSPVSIIPHVEANALAAAATTKIGRQPRQPRVAEQIVQAASQLMAAAAIDDNDLQLATSGEGEQSVSRTFQTSEGTTSVVVRYRFVTSEVPGGYFGTEFNDYFSVSLRSQQGSDIENESNTMNGLGLPAFDSAGATAWRTVTLNTNPEGDTIQLDIAVANVADGLFDSFVVIDFLEERKDLVQPTLSWDNAAGGLTLRYTVEQDLENAVVINVHWASGAAFNNRIGNAIFSHTVPAGTAAGQGGPIAIPGANLAGDPQGVTHIIAASSETKIHALADANINYGANADSTAVSAGMLDVVKDGLRAAGQSAATITSTARSPEDQARAMFNNLVNPARPVATNVANQLALYAAAGDAVVNRFVNETNGLTLAQINAASAGIQAAMVDEINAQGPSNVSRHCANPADVSVVDVGASAFNVNNRGLFVNSVTPRLTRFINELATNNAYHLELEN